MRKRSAGWPLLLCLAALAAPAVALEGPASMEPSLAHRNDLVLCSDLSDPNWWKAWGEKRAPQNTAIVEGENAWGGKSKFLRATVQGNDHYGTSVQFKFKERTGAEPEEIYVRYYLKFDEDWKNATFGGKLPGMGGTYGKAGWGGRPVNGTDGWSARGLFNSNEGADATDIGFYCYHADMKDKYGSEWRFKPKLQHGRWYCVELYTKLNTPGKDGAKGKNDGILRGWIDGQVGFEKTDVRFRDVDTLKIEDVWLNVYHGGETQVPKQDIHLYLDHFVIARAYIGPLQAQFAPAKKEEKSAEPAQVAKAAPAIDPASHRDALLKSLSGEATKRGAKVFMNVMGQGQEVVFKGADAQGLTVELAGNKLPLRWKDVSNADLAQMPLRLLPDDAEAVFHAGALALAEKNEALAQKLADRLIELKSEKAKDLDALRK
ncbi:MAG: hypothetical protein HY291_15485 [Planctomycetes bacterium]|nr:hypothetical protein [Planctomycetota bacterium]